MVRKNLSNRIAVVLGANLRWTPFFYRYEKLLNMYSIPFDLILWDREQIEKDERDNLIKYTCADATNNHDPWKIFKFIKFSLFVKKTIRRNKYSKVLFLGTYACMPALIALFLKRNYKNKYWIDIRDITYELIKPFYVLEKIAIKYAAFTALSSRGFMSYLPSNDYLFIHNIDPTIDQAFEKFNRINDCENRIRISYIGNIGFFNEIKRFLCIFGNDKRYLLGFYGKGSEKVLEYCKECKILNVEFHGAFKREETVEYYRKTDVVYNVYGNSSANLQAALSNKLYYALKFHLPMIVSENTYMSEICNTYKFGIDFQEESNFADRFYEWYKSFDVSKAEFDIAWNLFLNEDQKTEKHIVGFIEGC